MADEQLEREEEQTEELPEDELPEGEEEEAGTEESGSEEETAESGRVEREEQRVDPIVALFNYYRAQGYTDEQIIRGLAALQQSGAATGEEEDETPPSYLTPEEAVEWKVQKRIEKLERKLEGYFQQLEKQSILSYNAQLIDSVLAEYGYTQLTDAQKNAVVSTFRELFPTVDTTMHRLNKRQVEVVIREALGVREKGSRGDSSGKLPKELPKAGAKRASLEQGVGRAVRETSAEERRRRWLEL